MFNFGEELYIWTHSIYFQVKILILLKSDGKSLQFDELLAHPTFWEQIGSTKNKGERAGAAAVGDREQQHSIATLDWGCSRGAVTQHYPPRARTPRHLSRGHSPTRPPKR